MKNNLTFIIPIHKIEELEITYLTKCLESVKNSVDEGCKVLLVMTKESYDVAKTTINNYMFANVVLNLNSSDIQSMINFGVETITTDYFSVLEFDDEISKEYFKIMESNFNDFDEIDMLIPTIVEVDNSGRVVKTSNIQAWSRQLVGENGEVGFLNKELLASYTDFKLSGSIINKKSYQSINGLKVNIEFSFILEFLLRATKNNQICFVVPKAIYKHTIDRENSITNYFIKNYTKSDFKFWFETAYIESEFLIDRTITKPSVV